MQEAYGPLGPVETTAVLECAALRTLKTLNNNLKSLEASVARTKNDIVRTEGEYQMVLASVLKQRGAAVPPGKKASVRRNPDGTVSILVS